MVVRHCETINMNVNVLKDIMVGVVIFVAVQQLIDTLITGTDTGSVLIQALLLLVIGIAVIIGVFKAIS